MSYANRKEMSGNRTVAIVIVALLHLVLGYALVTGLAYDAIKKATQDLKTFDVTEEPPPPPEEPPPPPPEQPQLPPPPTSPPAIVRMDLPPPPMVVPPTPPVVNVVPIVRAPIAPPAPPAPPAPKTVKPASAKGDVRSLFSDVEYPPDALERGDEGRVKARLTIGTNGRVTGCSVIESSGNNALDKTTCSVLSRRARFTPATDSNGNPTTDTYTTPAIVWKIIQ